MMASSLSHPASILLPSEGERRDLNSELWHACAGPLVSLPTVGSRVVYLPQGHSEQVAASTQKEVVDARLPAYPNLPSQLVCQLRDVILHADVETDEVYCQMTLQPILGVEKEFCVTPEVTSQSKQPTIYFCKTLTASDTSTHGGFSIPRRAAEKVFPPLDFEMQPPAQLLVARDIHETDWNFRHIYRGQPKRHLLTTGWSMFISAKRLIAGDSVLFIRDERGKLLLGIRRASRPQAFIPSSVLSSDSMHIGVLAAAAHALNTSSCFTVFYNPRASPSGFVVPFSKFEKAVYHTRVSVGMRFRMLFETEESSIRRYMGTITGVSDVDPVRWPNSHWRSIKVGWDESTAGECQRRVSSWEIELLTTFFVYPPTTANWRLRQPWPESLGTSLSTDMHSTWMQYQNGSNGLADLTGPGMGVSPLQHKLNITFDPSSYDALGVAALQDNSASKQLHFAQKKHATLPDDMLLRAQQQSQHSFVSSPHQQPQQLSQELSQPPYQHLLLQMPHHHHHHHHHQQQQQQQLWLSTQQQQLLKPPPQQQQASIPSHQQQQPLQQTQQQPIQQPHQELLQKPFQHLLQQLPNQQLSERPHQLQSQQPHQQLQQPLPQQQLCDGLQPHQQLPHYPPQQVKVLPESQQPQLLAHHEKQQQHQASLQQHQASLQQQQHMLSSPSPQQSLLLQQQLLTHQPQQQQQLMQNQQEPSLYHRPLYQQHIKDLYPQKQQRQLDWSPSSKPRLPQTQHHNVGSLKQEDLELPLEQLHHHSLPQSTQPHLTPVSHSSSPVEMQQKSNRLLPQVQKQVLPSQQQQEYGHTHSQAFLPLQVQAAHPDQIHQQQACLSPNANSILPFSSSSSSSQTLSQLTYSSSTSLTASTESSSVLSSSTGPPTLASIFNNVSADALSSHSSISMVQSQAQPAHMLSSCEIMPDSLLATINGIHTELIDAARTMGSTCTGPNNTDHVLLPSVSSSKLPFSHAFKGMYQDQNDAHPDLQRQTLFGVNNDLQSMILPASMSVEESRSYSSSNEFQSQCTSHFEEGPPPVLDMDISFSSNMFNGCLDDSGLLQQVLGQANAPVRTYTKVYKTGSVGRSLDVTRFSNYGELRCEIARLFGLDGQLENPRSGWQLIFVDKENDWLLLGDDPWEEFVNNVRSIKILSPSEVFQMQDGVGLLTAPPKQTSSSCNEGTMQEDSQNPGSVITPAFFLDY